MVCCKRFIRIEENVVGLILFRVLTRLTIIMRLFIAIQIPKDIREDIVRIEQSLSALFRAKWVGFDNIHLTLKFLGEIDEKRLDEVKEILYSTAKRYNGFPLSLKGIGGFPDLRRPRVIWIGVKDGERYVVNIMDDLEEKFVRFGLEPEKRKKTAHITIGRVKDRIKMLEQKEREDIERLDYKSRLFEVDSVSLVKSILTPEGPVYTVVGSYPLG